MGSPAGWPPRQSVAESRRVIETILNGPESFAVCLKRGGGPIGAVELKLNGRTNATTKDDECELGYWLGKPFWGNGYASEASQRLIRRGFNELGMAAIWLEYYDGNERSKRVAEKCGFVRFRTDFNADALFVGEKRVVHRSVLTRERWRDLSGSSSMNARLFLSGVSETRRGNRKIERSAAKPRSSAFFQKTRSQIEKEKSFLSSLGP